MDISRFIQKALFFIYLAAALATPIIFTTFNTELYEIPKMYFVYIVATVIFFLTLIKFTQDKKAAIPNSIIVYTFAVFVLIQIVSAFFSIDKFTSVFGFPTRLNGGLLSQFAYFVIFACALINLNLDSAKKILLATVIAAFAVSFWGIPSHFGRDPSCLVLTGNLTSSCWKKEFDPTLRIFSTLGQPNWLASYLVLVLPISIAFLASNKNKAFFFLSSIAIFTAAILTNSRAGLAGLAVAITTFLLLFGTANLKKNLNIVAPLLGVFAIITVMFGSILTSRIKEAVKGHEQQIDGNQQQSQNTKPAQSALESGGTESGAIRLIVWRGAADIFKHWPILGSGPETFVSSYFMFRPLAHNQTTEWEFFYNKAHNEFLNYLANTGVLGFSTYIALLASLLISIYKWRQKSLLIKAILASFLGYLTAIFFGFSTVATQTTFFIFAACTLIISERTSTKTISLKFSNENLAKTAAIIFCFLGLFVIIQITRMYLSNVSEKRAENFSKLSLKKQLNSYNNAVKLFPFNNPYLLADYSASLALASSALENPDAAKPFIAQADAMAQKSSELSPNNFLIAQRIAKIYILLAGSDPTFNQEAENVGTKLTKLAPTYPISYLTNAKIQIVLENHDKAFESIQKALLLKSDYVEAKGLLDQITDKSLQ